MRYTFGLGSYFGIPVKIHLTFPLILIAFGLEAGLRGGWSAAGWAVLLVLAVFVCVVLHELGHSLQVKRFGINVRDIVLLPIGGMARAESIPDDPRQEIIVAVSGPLVNFALAGLFLPYVLLRFGTLDMENDFIAAIVSINIVLGTFNLIPAFPMDGGRILRGLLAMRLPYLTATRWAKNIGQAIAIIFVVLGFLYTNLIMLPLIAVVVFFGAMSEESMIRAKINLRGKSVFDFMRGDIPLFNLDNTVDAVAPFFQNEAVMVLPATDDLQRIPAVVLRSDIPSASCGRRLPPRRGEASQAETHVSTRFSSM